LSGAQPSTEVHAATIRQAEYIRAGIERLHDVTSWVVPVPTWMSRDRALRPSSLRNLTAALAARNGAHGTADRTGSPDEEGSRPFAA
jgi:hypothetical protein